MDLLGGIRVISFNHFLMGPLGIQILADLGADVIAVEPIEGSFQRRWSGADVSVDGQSALFLCAGRNKRSIALNLKSAEGLEVARRLVAGADVVAENYRPGVMEKLGLGFDAVKAMNPQVVYASASGFGADGPYAELPGQDLLIQALSGLAAATGEESTGPRAVGVSAADHHGAALYAMAIMAALLGRTRRGRGTRVDVNLLSAAIDLQAESFACYLNLPEAERPASVQTKSRLAGWYYPGPYGIYAASDGYVAISLAALEPLAEALDEPELRAYRDDAVYENRVAIAQLVERAARALKTGEIVERMRARKLWCAPVNDYAEVVHDPQVQHNQSFVTVEGATGTPVSLVSHPVRYDGELPEMRLAPQPLGAQTSEILAQLGYDDAQIAALAASNAVRVHQSAAVSQPL